ncbi:hypothetical protein UFOVP1361_54 [uncultured Caudovirales phage]|uniref:DUF5681 domain-containing protein n=1 Tax=uncultured Caudovirales phage TaxID=2100421 RepID=A0A6J5RYK7_9CAUD|nr:hypothetical protein UFOVP1361_54 [uncultured Caudovirales phage]
MAYAKGVTGNVSGRPKGIKDKRLVYKTVREQLEAAGFNPVSTMIKIAEDESHPVQTRRQATKDLLDKAYPDLRAVEHTGDVGTYFNLSVVKAIEKKKKSVDD